MASAEPEAAPRPAPGETGVVAWLYLRALGLVYLCAFLSFWVQLEGLIGPEGILPAEELMEAARQSPSVSVWTFPTWCWWLGASSASLHLQAALGVLLSLLLAFGLANVPLLLLLWSLYLSLATVGRIFMGYQWDNLLLEAGLLAALLVPLGSLFAHRWRSTPTLALWLHRLLVFRLMFSSGFVKLSSGDLAWRNLSAMRFHYETQPIPARLSWYVHQLPEFVHEASVLLVFGVQLVAPFLLFAPRRVRHVGALSLAGLQGLILLTGNYGFFNLLALALILTCLDDRALLRRLPFELSAWLGRRPFTALREGVRRNLGIAARAGAGALLGLLGAFTLAGTVGLSLRGDGLVGRALDTIAPYRSVNRYGLFAVMTTERPEIEVQGSDDGVSFHPYVFKHKVGPLDRSPAFILPHMPRLDWQMWFAALGSAERNPWFSRFLFALLEGRRPVLELLEHDPFDGRPPRFVRATFWDYRFTRMGERWSTGRVWVRSERGLYFQAVEKPDSSGR